MANDKKTEQIELLARQIHHHNRKYFIDNEPEISDEEFDVLVEKLRKLDPQNPALFELIGEIGDVEHPVPMLSIDKRYNYEDIRKWVTDTGDKNYLVEPKYDGMAARYQNGLLATRGNGALGEDISHRLSQLNVIGKLPKDNSEVRGEIIIPLTYFNENLADAYKNPRNAVVGIVKSKKVKPEGIKALLEGGVHFVVYDKAKSRKVSAEDLLDKDIWEALLEETLQTDYPLDGIVIKVVDEDMRKKLGATAHHERWQVAYKLPAERKWSKVKEIKDQVGRTGRVTSVAIIEPIQLSGATVTNVTLHNFEYMRDSKIGVGSEVEVTRSGEVIPFITRVKSRGRPHKSPSVCPVCKAKLIVEGKYLECPNPNCPARKSQSIEHFFKSLGVEELGLKTIEKFMDVFGISSPIQFYDLKPEQISILDGFGEKSAENIVKNIQATLNSQINPTQLLMALGIKEFGKSSSRWITSHYKFDEIPSLTIEQLEAVPGIGPRKAEAFVREIKEKWDIVEDLKKRGLKLKKEPAKQSNGPLSGKTFAITGSFEGYTRDEIINLVEQSGGEYKTSITKNLDYLIAGKGGGSKKEKAEKLKVKIIEVTDITLFIREVEAPLSLP